MIYMDDILVMDIAFEEALDNLQRVLEAAAQFGLEINWKKCGLLQTSEEFLATLLRTEPSNPPRRRRQIW